MLKCRKNYCNLLLLSVMLFALGASVHSDRSMPGVNVGLYSAESHEPIQWQQPSGTVVYRGQQLTATAGNEFIWKNHNVLEMLEVFDVSGKEVIFLEQLPKHNRYDFAVSRAPPEIV